MNAMPITGTAHNPIQRNASQSSAMFERIIKSGKHKIPMKNSVIGLNLFNFFSILFIFIFNFNLRVLFGQDSLSSQFVVSLIRKYFVRFLSVLSIRNSLSSAVSSWRGRLQSQAKFDFNDYRVSIVRYKTRISLVSKQTISLRATYVGIQRKFARFATAFPLVIETPRAVVLGASKQNTNHSLHYSDTSSIANHQKVVKYIKS